AMALRTEIHAAARRRTIREFGQGQGCFPKGGARTGDYAAPASDRPVSFFLLVRFLLFPERVRFGLCCGTCVVTFSQRGRDILIELHVVVVHDVEQRRKCSAWCTRASACDRGSSPLVSASMVAFVG